MNVNHPSIHLSVSELHELLSTDESTDLQVKHLESCEVCQSQLTALAGDPDTWSDVQSFLSGEREPRWKPDLSLPSDSTPLEDQVLKLLHAPNHPELLGRLGRYDIERMIGSGGMGVVLKAHDSDLNRPIAIKLLAPHLSHVGAARERFAREGRAAAAVVHEHVVAIYNVEAAGALPFLVMQYVPGRSLQARVDEDGPLSVEEILRIGMQAATGLAAAHAQGLVHRDVKPSNILLEDTVERAVLTDFGLARAMDDASLTQTGFVAGTPHYMSPEQATGGEIDARSDLFSLGAVLYFMATGHPPFRASGALAVLHRICREKHRPVRQCNKDVPDELANLIDRLLEKKPSRRLASAEDVRLRMASLLSQAQRHGFHRRPFGIRRKTLAGLALIAVGSAAGAAGWITTVKTHSEILKPSPSPQTTMVNAEVVADGEMEFSTTLEAARRSLRGADRDSFYARSGDEEWRTEIDSLQRALDKIEFDNH
jgi:eukaryotic-like serine/threonine-protein kinase